MLLIVQSSKRSKNQALKIGDLIYLGVILRFLAPWRLVCPNDKWEMELQMKCFKHPHAHPSLNNHRNPLAVLHYLGLARDSLRS